MKITTFNQIITESEGGKISISIAQVAEVVRKVNIATNGEFYKLIKETSEGAAEGLLTISSVKTAKKSPKSKSKKSKS